VAFAVQVLLLWYFLVLGLGWGGFWYLANLGQAAALLVLALALIWKRPLLVVPLPVVSLLLYLTFQAVDPSLKTTACTATELSALPSSRRHPAHRRSSSSPNRSTAASPGSAPHSPAIRSCTTTG
jgi:hypothetical protein